MIAQMAKFVGFGCAWPSLISTPFATGEAGNVLDFRIVYSQNCYLICIKWDWDEGFTNGKCIGMMLSYVCF